MCYNVNVDCRFGDRVQILVSQLISLCTHINQMPNVSKCEKDKTMIKKEIVCNSLEFEHLFAL